MLDALRVKTPSITETIDAGGRATLIKLGGHLTAQGLITQVIKSQAEQARTVLEGADELMTAVQDKVKNDPANFDKFLIALRSSELGDIADMLEREYCEFEIIFMSQLFPSLPCLSN